MPITNKIQKATKTQNATGGAITHNIINKSIAGINNIIPHYKIIASRQKMLNLSVFTVSSSISISKKTKTKQQVTSPLEEIKKRKEKKVPEKSIKTTRIALSGKAKYSPFVLWTSFKGVLAKRKNAISESRNTVSELVDYVFARQTFTQILNDSLITQSDNVAIIT